MIDAAPEPFRVEQNGHLRAAGVAWWQPIDARYDWRQKAIYWPILLHLLALVVIISSYNKRPELENFAIFTSALIFLGQCVFCGLTAAYCSVYDLVKVYFVSEGGAIEITQPHKWFTRADNMEQRRVSTLVKKLWDANSIEVIPIEKLGGGHYIFGDRNKQFTPGYAAYGVKMFFKDGTSRLLGDNLRQGDARIVQTQLDAAWREAWRAASFRQSAAQRPTPVEDEVASRQIIPDASQVTEERF